MFWRALFIVSYGAWVALETWIPLRDRRKRTRANQDRGSLRIVIMAIFVAVLAAWFAAFTQAWARIQLFHFQAFVIGLALMWAGMALRFWAVLVLGRFFRITVTVQDEHRLIDNGPYRLLRHPAYSGSLITLIGLGLAFGNWLSLAVLVLLPLLAFIYRMRVEEAALRARFGPAYDRYVADRWLLVPYLI